MQSRRKFVGGNWKSNNTLQKSLEIVETVVNKLNFNQDLVDVIVAPVFVHLTQVKSAITNATQVSVQNISKFGFGAYTGEISAEHVADLGLKWVILGHSERRHIAELKESDAYIAEKAVAALNKGLNVIYCVGETFEQREGAQTEQVLTVQVTALVDKLKASNVDVAKWNNIVVAYEPVWAIGTGKTATPQIAEQAHVFTRKLLQDLVSADVAGSVRIIYGGSVTKDNCNELIKEENVDGFLVGGASLKADFITIVESCNH